MESSNESNNVGARRAVPDVEQRLEKLERANARMEKANRRLTFISLALGAGLVLMFALAATKSSAESDSTKAKPNHIASDAGKTPSGPQVKRGSPEPVIKSRADLTRAMTQLQGNLSDLDKSHQAYVESAGKLDTLYSKLSDKVKEVAKLADAAKDGGDSSNADLFAATKQMREMQMSFNVQYLQLQSQMQDENRQFTLLSNIMKTKHDTVKNSINNIR